MVRRFLFLLFVAGVSGTLGLWVGFLFAPAPGAETRASLAAFFDEHDKTLSDFYSRSRAALDEAVDVVSSDSRRTHRRRRRHGVSCLESVEVGEASVTDAVMSGAAADSYGAPFALPRGDHRVDDLDHIEIDGVDGPDLEACALDVGHRVAVELRTEPTHERRDQIQHRV